MSLLAWWTVVVSGAAVAAAGDTLADAAKVGCRETPTTTTSASPTTITSTTITTVALGVTTTIDPVREARNQLDCVTRILKQTGRFHAGLGFSDFKNAHGDTDKAEVADLWPYLTSQWGWVGRPITAVALLFGARDDRSRRARGRGLGSALELGQAPVDGAGVVGGGRHHGVLGPHGRVAARRDAVAGRSVPVVDRFDVDPGASPPPGHDRSDPEGPTREQDRPLPEAVEDRCSLTIPDFACAVQVRRQPSLVGVDAPRLIEGLGVSWPAGSMPMP